MRRLNRILGFAELRNGAALLHFPIQAFTLWDFHVLFALDRWRARGRRPRARLDRRARRARCAVARSRGRARDNPDWCMPDIDATPRARRRGARASADSRTTAASATTSQVGPPGTLLLVTGSNMSGKSTLLRAIGLNTVLAQAGGCVCAARLRLPPCDLQTSIRVQDSLELGLSYFMAALARLKGVVDAAERPRDGRVLLYLLDEILQGTNSAERGHRGPRGRAPPARRRRHRRDDDARSESRGRGTAQVVRGPGALHRERGRAGPHALRLPAAPGPRHVAKRASPDADDRHRPERAPDRRWLRFAERRRALRAADGRHDLAAGRLACDHAPASIRTCSSTCGGFAWVAHALVDVAVPAPRRQHLLSRAAHADVLGRDARRRRRRRPASVERACRRCSSTT